MLLLVSSAWAFCGTFVGSAGSDLRNHASRVILARSGEETTLTLAADYEGDLAAFGLIIPVPEVVTADDVRLINPDLIDRVDGWSMPRMVAYTCDDLATVERGRPAMGCTDMSLSYKSAGEADAGVTVEAAFTEGEYEIVVLSAEESGDLLGWLDTNGYTVPEGGEAILQEYIDAGVYFLAAKVSLDAVPSGQNWLNPLQIRYTSAAWSLPIRIGTIASGGEAQEVLVYALTENDSAVGISNYPEVTVDDECMLRDAGDDFAVAYSDALDDALDGEAGWIQEYSWSLTTACDPCTSQQGLTPEELEGLGLPGYHGRLTRLRVRYTPEQATQDLTFYDTRIADNAQIRYIRYLAELEETFPVCNEGFVANPGTCDAGQRAPVVGCAGAAPAAGVGLFGAFSGLLAVAALRRRA